MSAGKIVASIARFAYPDPDKSMKARKAAVWAGASIRKPVFGLFVFGFGASIFTGFDLQILGQAGVPFTAPL